jgi:DNA-binding HxlR family transcriptional regulator
MQYRCNRCDRLSPDVLQATDVLGRRWALALICASHAGAVRFNEFRQALGDVPPRTLAQRLVELEQAGVLERRVTDARPPRVEYVLTARGRRLKGVVDVIETWSIRI